MVSINEMEAMDAHATLKSMDGFHYYHVGHRASTMQVMDVNMYPSQEFKISIGVLEELCVFHVGFLVLIITSIQVINSIGTNLVSMA